MVWPVPVCKFLQSAAGCVSQDEMVENMLSNDLCVSSGHLPKEQEKNR